MDTENIQKFDTAHADLAARLAHVALTDGVKLAVERCLADLAAQPEVDALLQAACAAGSAAGSTVNPALGIALALVGHGGIAWVENWSKNFAKEFPARGQ